MARIVESTPAPADQRGGVDDSRQSTSAQGAAAMRMPDLPEGWQQAEPDEWSDPYPASRRRSVMLRVAFAVVVVGGVIGVLLWVAASHYARGVEALNDRAYSRAMGEFSSATVLVFPYRDARALEDQARRGLEAETVARQAEEGRVSSVVAELRDAGALLAAGKASAVVAALEAIPAADLRTTVTSSDAARASVAALKENLPVAATAALRKLEWGRAGRFAAALLVLDPASEQAATLASRAVTGKKLSAKLADGQAAARAGRWRTALRLGLAVVAVRKDFPGAAALVADAREALKPKPKPAPAPVVAPTPAAPAPAPATGGSTTVTPAQPPPP